MAKRNQEKVSKTLGIDNEWIAYCMDEVAFFFELEAIDEKGNFDWSKIRWVDDAKIIKNNDEFITFVEKQNKVVKV